ncbi:DNA-binding response regulator [Actinophytocola sp.]|uniref:DNA-binding response regulator n=1 Tax=Actinophytocola sp. TaxID=1872138 RepID=UPI003D6ABEC5
METAQVAIVRGEDELFARTAHLFAAATEVACAANDLNTWAATRPQPHSAAEVARHHRAGVRVRKVYRPGVLLNPSMAQYLESLRKAGADIRITQDEVNETIILDRRVAILAGDLSAGQRSYSVISQPEVVQGVASLFEAAWRNSTALAVYDAEHTELRTLAPRVLELLAAGGKDETAARKLGLGVRTYRRRVAELMAALGADTRFQAGVRARELGLV